MKRIVTAAAALLTMASQPVTAYPNHNVFDQPIPPLGQPLGRPTPEQQIRNLQYDIDDMKRQRMNSCLNSKSTYCSFDTGGW